MVISSGPGPRATNSTFCPPGTLPRAAGPSSPTATTRGVGPEHHQVGVAHVDRSWPWPTLQRSARRLDLGPPHVDRHPRGRRAARRGGCVTVRGPGGGGDHEGGPATTSPASSAAWARQRIPLPLISASLPSALRSSMVSVGPIGVGRPGGPDEPVGADPAVAVAQRPAPGRRRSAWRPSRSSRTRKSLPSPWCLVTREGGHGRLQSPSRAGTTASGFSAAPYHRDAGVAPEPHPLAAGEGLASGATRLGHGRRQRHPVFEVGQHLPVAERLAGGARQPPGPGRQAGRPRPPARRPPWPRSAASMRPADDAAGQPQAGHAGTGSAG